MNEIRILPLDSSHNERMISIMKASPVNANGLVLSFEKSPSVFAVSEMKYHDCRHLGFFCEGILKGFASMGYFDAYLKGVKETFFMFYNFYLLPEIRGMRLPEKAMKLFFSDTAEKAAMGLAVTLKGNRQAESFIGRQGYEWMPPSRIFSDWIVKSILFSIPVKNKTGYFVRNAGNEDIPDMVRLLDHEHRQRDFGYPFREEDFMKNLDERGLQIEDYYLALNRKGKIQGVCLAWDCSAFKRTMILKYPPAYYPVLLAYKALSALLPMAPFPKEGESFRELTLTDYAASDRDVRVMHALLSEIYRRHHNRKFHFMNFGSCTGDPLLKATKGFWCRDTVSHIVFSAFDPDKFRILPNLPYIDIAFL